MIDNKKTEIETRLLFILHELESQKNVSLTYSENTLSFNDEMKQIHEFIEFANEYGLAYETIVAAIESHPFILSGKAAIALLEVGLLFGYKTDTA
jgi:hypothetical protein